VAVFAKENIMQKPRGWKRAFAGTLWAGP